MAELEPRNHAADRLNGRSGDRFVLGAAPDVGDLARWTVALAERAAQEAASGPPEPEP